jgi:hypothetical protein
MNVHAKVGPRADRPGLAYLYEIFSLMYPGASVALRRAPGGRHAQAWALVPGHRNPFLLVPTGPAAASRASLGELQRRGVRGLTRMAQFASAVGALNLLPRLTVSRRDVEDVQSVIAHALSRGEVAVSLVVGRIRALQKPVLRVLAEDGVTLGFAKVGVSEITRSLVGHEAAVLRRFESHPPEHFTVPRVLGTREWGELSLLIQEPLPTGRAADIDVVRRAAVEISGHGGTATTLLRDSSVWDDLRRRVVQLPVSNGFAHELARAVEHIDLRSADTPLQVGWWHGDFAPWNMGWDGTRLNVWDWEGFTGAVPTGFDLLHYRFQGDVVVDGHRPDVAFRALLQAAPSLLSSWNPADPHLVVALYIIHLVTGLIETDDTQTRISRLDDWLGSALTTLLGFEPQS